MRHVKMRSTAALCVVLALAAGACGSDEKDSVSTDAATTTVVAPAGTGTGNGTDTTTADTSAPEGTGTGNGTDTTTGDTADTTASEGTGTGNGTDTTDASTGDTVAAPETELDSSAAIDINEQPRDALKQGGELRLTIAALPENWNPWNVNGGEADANDVLEPMYPLLFDFDEKAVATPNKDFLLDVKVEDGPPQIITYTLNPDAVWGDGAPITAKDFIAHWEAMINPDNQVVTTEGWDQIDTVEQGTDEYEVVVTYKTVYPDWQALFQPLLRAESVATPELFNEGWIGPIKPEWLANAFTIGTYDESQGIVEEVPNPNWWGDPALLDKVIFRVVSLDAVPQAYANGELDSFDIGPDPNGYAIASSTSSGEIRAAAGPNWRHITFNNTAGLIADKTIRQAIVRSLDRGQIGESDLAGIPWPAKPLNNHVFVENQAGYVDGAEDFEFDPDRAMSDLDAAGWVVGDDGIREKDGERLTVKFMQLVGVPTSENEAQLVQAQLADVGIEVEIADVPTDQFSEVLVNGDFEMIAFSWIGTPFPFGGIKQLYGTGSESNYAKSDLPEVDALIEQIQVETDVAKRTDLANEVDALLWDDVHTLPLYQRPELIAVNSEIANYGAFGFSSPLVQNWGYMK